MEQYDEKLFRAKANMRAGTTFLVVVALTTIFYFSKMSKGENVTTDTLGKICKVLECNVEDIMEFIPEGK